MRRNIAPPVPEGTKWCHGCLEALPLDRFGSRKDHGRKVNYSRCRPCHRKQARESMRRVAERRKHWDALIAKQNARKAPPIELPEELDLG